MQIELSHLGCFESKIISKINFLKSLCFFHLSKSSDWILTQYKVKFSQNKRILQ